MKKPSENALVTKLKLMYSGRISSIGYRELLGCESVHEIMNFLKNLPVYSKILVDFHNENFEIDEFRKALNKSIFSDFETIMRYDLSLLGNFHKYIVARLEIRCIIKVMLSVSSKSTQSGITDIPEFLISSSSINFEKLRNSCTYRDILESVDGSKYYKILKNFISDSCENDFDFTGAEVALQNFLYDLCFEIAKKSNQLDFTSFLGDYIDLKNFVLIYRMKRFYNFNADYIVLHMLKNGNIPQKNIENIVNFDINDIILKFRETRVGKRWFTGKVEFIDNVPDQMRFSWCSQRIRHSFDMISVAFSYVILCEIEHENIVRLVEGRLNGFTIDEISKNMVGI